MNKVSTLSIDLAKNVFQLLAFDCHHKKCFSKRLNRQQLTLALANLPPCTIVMESCSTAHYWGRICYQSGHTVKLIPAQHVTPFVRGNKNDKNDCMAIYEASLRPNIRCVPVKTEHQQAILALHRYRERIVSARTACINQTRSLLLEFGLVIPRAYKTFYAELNKAISSELHPAISHLIKGAKDELKSYEATLHNIEAELKSYNAHCPSAQIIQSIPGIGLLNASAFSASIDKGQAFNSAKDFGVWLGLTPRQYASGDKSALYGITKRGDSYLRKQLIHGARTIVNHAHKKHDDFSLWITRLIERRGKNKAVVATAHRMARLMWILLQKHEHYKPQFTMSKDNTRGQV